MRFAAMFFDDLDPRRLDADLTRHHFEYLHDNADRIVAAGGLKESAAGPFCGSMWVIEAENIELAQRLVDGDPYCLAGLRPDRRVFVWNRAPVDKQRNERKEQTS